MTGKNIRLTIRTLLCVTVLGFLPFVIRAQTSDQLPLSDYLNLLEQRFEVRFSYEAELLASSTIPGNPKFDLFQDALSYIEQTTIFKSERIDDRYIALKPKLNQFICGYIKDEKNGEPIEAVAIRDGNRIHAVSNAYGFFILPKIPGATFTTSHMAYEPTQISSEPTSNQCFEVLLNPNIAMLDEIVVTSLFTRGITKQKLGSFKVQTKNFGLLPGQVDKDILQIIQVLPGVESVDETISNINIRGGTQDENLILWNGIKMYQNGHFFGLISAFNPDLTEEVEVYKNGTPARYGESVSGVIAMKSKNQQVDSLRGAVGFNLLNGSAFAEFPITHTLGVQVSGRSSANSAIKTPVYNTYSRRIFQNTEIINTATSENGARVQTEEEFNFYDLSTRLLWDVSESSNLRINFLGMDNLLTFTEQIEDTNQSKRNELDQRSFAGSVDWTQQFSDQLDMNISGYATYYLLEAIDRDIFTTQELRQDNEILETGAKFEVQYQYKKNIRLQTGYHFTELGIANTQDVNLPRFRNYEKEVLRTHVGFIDGIFSFHNTEMQAGIRYNYFGKFNRGIIEPRLSINQSLSNSFSVQLLGELKSQTTTQRIDFQSDFFGIEKRRWILADEEDTPIIESKQVSLGTQYKKNAWLISAEGFYKEVDGITTANQGFQNQFQFIKSQGSYQAYGSELVINYQTNTFSVWLSHLYLKNEYTFDDLLPNTFPNNLDIAHTVNLAASYQINRFQFALGGKWHSGKPYTRPMAGEEIVIIDNEEQISYQSPNSSRLPHYFRTDFSANYLLKLSSRLDTQIGIAILNILNTKNILNIRYTIDEDAEGNARLNEVSEVSLGFTPNFSFQLLF